ncbi:MAG: FHA domain-containing protein, partial [Mycobacterium sp.]
MLTIWHDGSQHTFTAGHDVVIGRDEDADIRIVDPRISRAHLILRFEQGKWLAIDNGSVNGTFVNGYRRPVIDIHDGQSINIGNAGGPQLSFEVGQQRGRPARPPGAGSQRATEPSTVSWSTPPPPAPPSRSHPPGQVGG